MENLLYILLKCVHEVKTLKTSSFRLKEKQDKEIEYIAKKMKIDKSSAARKIIELGLKEYKKEEALEMIRKRQWTIWKAAAHSGESYRSFLNLLRPGNIPFPLSVDELRREFNEGSSE